MCIMVFSANICEARLRDYITIETGLSVITEYDSNRYRAPYDEEDELTFTVSPSLKVSMNVPVPGLRTIQKDKNDMDSSGSYARHYLDLNYEPGFANFRYADSTFNTNPTHKFDMLYEYRPSERLGFRLKDELIKEDNPELLDPYGDYNDRERYIVHTIIPSVEYKLGEKLLSEFLYQYQKTDFRSQNTDNLDSVQDSYALRNTYNVSSRTELRFGYEYSKKDYSEDENYYEKNIYRLGLGRKLSARSKIDANLGFEDRESSEIRNSVTDEVYDIEFQYNLNYLTTFKLRGGKRINDTSDGFTYKADWIEWELDKRLTPKTSVIGKLLYSKNDYYEESREDDFWGFDLSLKYDFSERLSSRLSYIWNERDSNDSEYDYTNNKVLSKTEIKF